MNIPELERLAEQYRTDPSIIFQMTAVIKQVDCGAAHCIAGQVCVNYKYKLRPFMNTGAMATKGKHEPINAMELAQQILRLDIDQMRRLFFKEHWPARFRNQPDTPALAAERIEHFVATEGKE